MSKIVWLFSLDCEQFTFLPLTTAGIKAYYDVYGKARDVAIELVHFSYHADAMRWVLGYWKSEGMHLARQMVMRGVSPVAAFSCYTWNMPTFLQMISIMKADCPDLVVVAGGPHVQHYEPYLKESSIDVVVLGEGEQTFKDLLDIDQDRWSSIPGLVFRSNDGAVVQTAPRKRLADLSVIPAIATNLVPRDYFGRAIRWAAYETMRGCSYKCAFCQWGTGAIGVPVSRYPLLRVKDDLEALVNNGIDGILFCDSNFGAMSDDLEKAEHLIWMKKKYGRPVHFATCWSKTHNARVQSVVRRLHQHKLLEHYTMALQTLTPLALELSNRVNMKNYAEVVRNTVSDGVPIVSELIWGLPGETLENFSRNLDELTRVFPSHTIYPYALLPGTELFDKREEYRIETIQMAPYGEARADYIISCLSFDHEEGMRGYHLITAAIVLYRGCVLPLTLRYLALDGGVSVSTVMQEALDGLRRAFLERFPGFGRDDSARLFEKREFIYRWILENREQAFAVLRQTILQKLPSHLVRPVVALLSLDEALCPRKARSPAIVTAFDFCAADVFSSLEKMTMPSPEAFVQRRPEETTVDHSWDFGDSLVPQNVIADQTPKGFLKGRYPVWP